MSLSSHALDSMLSLTILLCLHLDLSILDSFGFNSATLSRSLALSFASSYSHKQEDGGQDRVIGHQTLPSHLSVSD